MVNEGSDIEYNDIENKDLSDIQYHQTKLKRCLIKSINDNLGIIIRWLKINVYQIISSNCNVIRHSYKLEYNNHPDAMDIKTKIWNNNSANDIAKNVCYVKRNDDCKIIVSIESFTLQYNIS